VRAQQRLHRAGVDVHDLGRLALFSISPAARSAAMRCCALGAAVRGRPLQDSEAHFRAERLVFAVVGAQRVTCVRTVFLPNRIEHDRVVDELRAARLREGGPKKEVAIAVHDEDARARGRILQGPRRPFRVEGIPMSSSPAQLLEQVAEDVEIRAWTARSRRNWKRPDYDPGGCSRGEIGNEKDRHSSPTRPPPSRAAGRGSNQVFFQFLASAPVQAPDLYILGDLFEYWAGDDDIGDPFNAKVVAALAECARGGTRILVMHGNRDFLFGPAFAQASGAQLVGRPGRVRPVR